MVYFFEESVAITIAIISGRPYIATLVYLGLKLVVPELIPDGAVLAAPVNGRAPRVPIPGAVERSTREETAPTTKSFFDNFKPTWNPLTGRTAARDADPDLSVTQRYPQSGWSRAVLSGTIVTGGLAYLAFKVYQRNARLNAVDE